jgi:sigma-B regulation protein RsbU (phosphoserine phosphatase)
MALARRVSGPVVSLVGFMETVGGGDFTARPPKLGGAREFRRLSEALDRMLQDLRDRTRLRSAMGVAKEVQQGLLPARPPEVDGLDVFGVSVYCDETGGDYFDYLVLDMPGSSAGDGAAAAAGDAPRGLLVAVGDVVGHGIGSAIFMAGARAVLHSRAPACGHLGDLMTHLNEQLVGDTGGRRFVTMLLCYVDRRRGTACWANAGHDPAVVYDPLLNTFVDVGAGGDIPLGIEPDVAYVEQPFAALRAGQVIVLGTDGVWETVNAAGEAYGRERLKEVVRALASGSAQQIATAIHRDVESFRGGEHQRDDVTVVVIKVVPMQGAGTAKGSKASGPSKQQG